jgi:putative membrane protein
MAGVVAVMVLFWGAVAWIVIALMRRNTRDHEVVAPSSQPDAMRLLDARYARGEIDDGEYRHRREVLRGDSADHRLQRP